MNRSLLMRVVASAGLANAMLIPCWREFNAVSYYVAEPRAAASFVATLGAVALLTGALAAVMQAITVTNRKLRGLVTALLLACVFVAVLHLSFTLIDEAWPRGSKVLLQVMVWRSPLMWLLATLIAAGGFIWFLARGSGSTARLFMRVGITAAPVLALNALHAARSVVTGIPPEPVIAASATPAKPGAAVPRVIWVVFDEMNAEFATGDAPKTLGLPNLEALRRESVHASAGAAQTAKLTVVALPSLLTGQRLEGARPSAPDELSVTVEGDYNWQPLSRMSTVFDDAAALGRRAAVAGWFHPYCRLFGAKLAACYWSPGGDVLPGARWHAFAPQLPAHRQLIRQVGRSVFSAESLATTEEWEFLRAKHARRVAGMHKPALEMITDPKLAFVLVHLPLPHLPGVADPHTRRLSVASTADYIGNLRLADQLLGEYKAAMQNAGVWDSSALIVTADHMLRVGWRGTAYWDEALEKLMQQSSGSVPFLVRIPGQTEAVPVPQRFNAVVLRDLTRRILTGELKSPAMVAEYLSRAKT